MLFISFSKCLETEINTVARDGNFHFKIASLGTDFSACNCLLDSRNCLLVLWYWVPTINWIGQKGRLQFIGSFFFWNGVIQDLRCTVSRQQWQENWWNTDDSPKEGDIPWTLNTLFDYRSKLLVTRTQICQVFDSGLSNMGSVVFLFATTAWNLLILFVNSSAQLSLVTSNVGYRSCSSSTSSKEPSLSMTSHWWPSVISASQFKQLGLESGGTGVSARGK